MNLLKPINIVLFYLSIAVLFPSYHGYSNGQEFHFLGLIDPHIEELNQTLPEIEEYYTHSHSHSLLYFHHEDKLKLTKTNKITQELLIPDIEIPDENTRQNPPVSVSADINNELIFNRKNTGLSPPVA